MGSGFLTPCGPCQARPVSGERLSILLVVGQGAWETHPTGALPSTLRLAAMLQEKGIRCELDLCGHDVSHDWE